ncbi:uncharacterized protein LOC142036685 isoform X2 [Buteo buteo]|uniref:uncharacterized protein LOC142036685 isoform X2 n=1 Tax=Buteo buteo TaxID=30397 RepID=UPI003EBA8C8D
MISLLRSTACVEDAGGLQPQRLNGATKTNICQKNHQPCCMRVAVPPPVHCKQGREKRRRGPLAPVELLPETRLLASVDCFSGGGAAPLGELLRPRALSSRPQRQPGSAGHLHPLKRSGGASGDPAGSSPAERPPDTREGLAVRALGPFEAPPAEERAVEAGGGAPGAGPPGAGPRGGGCWGGQAPAEGAGPGGRGASAASSPSPPGAAPRPRRPPAVARAAGAARRRRPGAGALSAAARSRPGHPLPGRESGQPPAAAFCPREKPPLLPNASVAPHRNAESARQVLRFLPAKNKEESFH